MTDLNSKIDLGLNNAQFDSYNKSIDRGGVDRNRKKIAQLSEDFEAIFLQLMLKSMRETVPKSGLVDGGNGEDVFRSMLDSEYAQNMAKQRFSGIADSIERSLLENIGAAVQDAAKNGALKQYEKSVIKK